MCTSKRVSVFAGWQSVEIYALPLRRRCKAYISVPSLCADWEPIRTLCVPTPASFSCHSNLIFSGGCYHDTLQAVVKLKMAVVNSKMAVVNSKMSMATLLSLLRRLVMGVQHCRHL